MTGFALARRIAIHGLLGSWLALTVLEQLQWRPQLRQRIDPASLLVPGWRFFGPRPGMHDHHLLYRDELSDGTVTPWREQPLLQERVASQTVWHPNRRTEKAVLDSVIELTIVMATEDRLGVLQTTVPYLVLLNFVSGTCEHHPSAVRTQFLLAKSTGFDDAVAPQMLFASGFHLLAGER